MKRFPANNSTDGPEDFPMLRRFQVLICAIVVSLLTGLSGQTVGGERLQSLRVLGPEYPQVFFFRQSEGFASNRQVSYERWDAMFSRLMGIEGKVLNEEIPGRSERNVEFFTRFKQEHPKQLVMLHYNGNARDPRDQSPPGQFFAGHWIYYNGAKILEDVPAEQGETDIKVDDPTLFLTETGRYQNANEDVGLAMLDADGKPDWNRSEQVQLVSIDRKRGVIRVKRGAYGTKPMAFPAGRGYAAAHMSEGPWGGKSNLLWYYNYSTRCPRDAQGRTASDILCADLTRRFLPGGELAAFDGLEFDVMHNQIGGRGRRGADCDADGQIDKGVFDGMNVYGQGVINFCRQLRQKFGPDRLILADGMSVGSQRAFGILNGIESEGWPTLSDWEIADWSGGLNRHWYWSEHGFAPVFNYINHKFTTAGEKPGQRVRPDVPFAVHRLVFAVAMFTDSALCYSTTPNAEDGEVIGIWDEFRKGTEDELGWLGRARGPAVRLAERAPELLASAGSPFTAELADRVSGENVKLTVADGALKIVSTDPNAEQLRFRLRDVPCDGPDLFVSVAASGAPLAGFSPDVARLMWVGIAAPQGKLVLAELPETGMCLRGQTETELDTETGAAVGYTRAAIGGETREGYRAHPPYRDGVGYTFWQRDVDVPAGAKLRLYTGMGEKSPERSDGVTFSVLAAGFDGGKPGEFRKIFETSQKAFQWVPHEVPLGEFAGQRVRLKFVADCGPNDNSTTDHAYWGDVEVVSPSDDTPTSPVSYMTWLGQRDFTSGFYFNDVQSKKIDLEWRIEGAGPVSINSVRAYPHADAIYREFEGGLVLANPSPRPYTFDLGRLFPGQTFRRLKGTARQDPATNNGAPVGTTLTLGPKEGLFLVRTSTE